MNEYLPEEYSRAIEMINPIVEKYGLDSILVNSIVRGAIEKESQPIQPASTVWKSKKGNTYSLKPANIKVNLSFALSNAFRMKTIFKQEDIWLVLAILHLAIDLFTSAVEKVDEASSLVLLSTFRLQEASKEDILNYTLKIQPEESKLTITDELVQNALDNLEDLRCVDLKDGKYHVVETIDSSIYIY